ncbi:MAG: hypothetical protein ACFCU6_00830, partial [Balneolaceae bacterium]
MKQGIPALIILALLSARAVAVAPGNCAFLLDRELPGWSFPAVGPDVMEGVTREGKNPLVTTGDFDNDQKTDVAFLVQTGEKETKIAVCLSGEPGR